MISATALTSSGAVVRPFGGEADWWAIRELLLRTHATTPVGFNWDIRHWDGNRARPDRLDVSRVMRGAIGLWEYNGRLVAAVHGEEGGDAIVQVDPDFRQLMPALLEWAEGNLALAIDGRTRLRVFTWDYDLMRNAALHARGYERLSDGGWVRIVRFGAWNSPEPYVRRPYVLRTTSETTISEDAPRIANLFNAAFGRTFHTGDDYIRFVTMSPSFSHDLNLVAEAPDGHIAALVGVTYDALNRYGIFEPVCTDPRDRRHGLARALIYEGMRRLRALGAVDACVETGDMVPANELYRACGFTEEYRGHVWEREL